MLVVGGYNSSNTCNLARICAERVRTFHIADPECLVSAARDPAPADRGAVDGADGGSRRARLAARSPGRSTIGLTAGASTPNNIVGQVIDRLERFA